MRCTSDGIIVCIVFFRKGRSCTVFATIRCHSSDTWRWWICRCLTASSSCWFDVCRADFVVTMVIIILFIRRGMRGFSTSFWLIMLRSCFLLFTHLQLAWLARSMVPFLEGHKDYSSVWRRSLFLFLCRVLFIWYNCLIYYQILRFILLTGGRFLRYWGIGLRRGFKLLWLLMENEFWGLEILAARSESYNVIMPGCLF